MARDAMAGDQQVQKGGFGNEITDKLEIGQSVIFRPWSSFSCVFGFLYPAFSIKDNKEKLAKINLSEFPGVDVLRSPIEEAMLTVYINQRNRINEKLIKAGKKAMRVDKLVKDKWGAFKGAWACAGEYKGSIQAIMGLKPGTYQPGGKSEVKEGIWHIQRKVKEGKLVFTPLLTKIKITAEQSRDKMPDTGKHWTNYVPAGILPEQYQCLLPVTFKESAYCHPEDVEPLREYVKKRLEAMMMDMPLPELPYYRPYPDPNTGDLAYVARDFDVPHVILNTYETGLMNEALVQKYIEHDYIWEMDESTQLSMLSGYYYKNKSGRMVEVTLEWIEKNITGTDDEGNAEVTIDGQPVVVYWYEGKLWKERFNPYLTDAEGEPLFGKDADLIAEEAKSLGIPMKDDKAPEPVDFRLYKKSTGLAKTLAVDSL